MSAFLLHIPFLRHDPAAMRDAWTLWVPVLPASLYLLSRCLPQRKREEKTA